MQAMAMESEIPLVNEEQGEEASPQPFKHSFPKVVIFAAALIGLLGVAGMIQLPEPEHKANLRSAVVLDEAQSETMALMTKQMHLWQAGKYTGDKCADNAKDVFSHDLAITSNAAFEKAHLLTKYSGVAGWCAFCKDMEVFDFTNTTAAFYEVGPGEIVQIATWVPMITEKAGGGKANHTISDIVYWNTKDGKFTKQHYVWAEPKTVDALFGKIDATEKKDEALYDKEVKKENAGDDFEAVVALMKMWGEGKFVGDQCQGNIKPLVSDNIKITFTQVDISTYYSGVAGICKWYADLAIFNFTGAQFHSYKVDDNKIVQTLTWTPALNNGTRAKSSVVDVGYMTIVDKKITGLQNFWADPLAVEGLFRTRLAVTDEEKEQEKYCNDIAPFLEIVGAPVHNNLAGKGPDKGKEGIAYRVIAHHVGYNSSELELHMHGVSNFTAAGEEVPDEKYQVGWVKENGVHGKFAAMNLKPGSDLNLLFHFYDPVGKKDVTLPDAALSFYDFDTGKDNVHSIEYLTIRTEDYLQYILTNETEINVTQDGNFTKFSATKEGTGADNPSDPMSLTVGQKNKAVTFLFKDSNDIHITVGASEGHTVRVFTFISRPSLLCAPTVMEDGSEVAAYSAQSPITIVRAPLPAKPVPDGAHAGKPAVLFLLALASLSLQHFLV